MRIDKIVLYNFGSYEGETIFDTNVTDDRNIILIGGKNGAGKTTLFTAIRLCLYGYMSMGYKNMNSYYTKAVNKLINNTAKMLKPVISYVQVDISISNGRELDKYSLVRKWRLNDSLNEVFSVTKNSVELTMEEIADFEKYVLSLIPPELFNLYFFDGEKIADFFLNEGGNTRIKEAFLTLCGYDTFEIMRKNFKRISSSDDDSKNSLNEYMEKKECVEVEQNKLSFLKSSLEDCINGIENCEADIKLLEKEYYQSGGISEDEWNKKIFVIKDEERKRDHWNGMLRKLANDVLPFLIIRNSVKEIKDQIIKENKAIKYKNFCEIIEVPEIKSLIEKNIDKVNEIAFKKFGDDDDPILNLSFEQSSAMLAQINGILSFDTNQIIKYKEAVKNSIEISAQARKELDNSSIATVQEYMRTRAELYEKKSKLLSKQVELEQAVTEQIEVVKQDEMELSKLFARLELELKKSSINDISAHAIVMLDKLQNNLYQKQIKKVESVFRKEISTLIRKTHFIDDIMIDNQFNIHIYRNETITIDKVREIINNNREDSLCKLLGFEAFEKLKEYAKSSDIDGIMFFFNQSQEEAITLPLEIDKASLSNGEKQIFIMALYHALIELCNHEVPFIIDTPFARIDTEHRRNISKYFFSRVKGQVFILSTNEEIDSDHVQIMRDKIAATYLLENMDNKRTYVEKNSYFEV